MIQNSQLPCSLSFLKTNTQTKTKAKNSSQLCLSLPYLIISVGSSDSPFTVVWFIGTTVFKTRKSFQEQAWISLVSIPFFSVSLTFFCLHTDIAAAIPIQIGQNLSCLLLELQSCSNPQRSIPQFQMTASSGKGEDQK